MARKALIFIDTETGGLKPDLHSLLTFGYVIADAETLETLVERELYLAPKDDIYHVTSKAMAVNGIDLGTHGALCATHPLETFLEDVKIYPDLTAAGWRVSFDLSFLWAHFLPESEWREVVRGGEVEVNRYRRSLQSVALDMGIDPGEAHTALCDCRTTLAVYRATRQKKAA